MATKRKTKPTADEGMFITTIRVPADLWDEVRIAAMQRAREKRATREPGSGRVPTDTSEIVREALVAYLKRGRK